MRTFTILSILLMMSLTSFSQLNLKALNSSANSEEQNNLSKSLTKYSVILLDQRELNKFVKSNKAEAKVNLAIDQDVNWSMTLFENEIRSGDYKAQSYSENGEPNEHSLQECNTYSGYINNDPNQYIRLFVNDEFIKGIIVDKEKGIFVIEPITTFIKVKNDSRLVVYNLADTQPGKGFCGTNDLKAAAMGSINKSNEKARLSSPTTCRILEVATEADGEYFTNHGSNTNNVFNDILAIMNVVDGVFFNTFNTRVSIVFQSVFTNASTDPYTSTDIYGNDVVTEFRNYWNGNRSGVPRDEATFFTGKNLVASNGDELFGAVPAPNGIGAICRDASNSYVFVTDRANNFYTVTHETGHLFNATHPTAPADCVPGNRSVMCQGTNQANVFFAASSQTQINNHLNAGDGCLRDYSSIRMTGPSILCSTATYEAFGGPVNNTNNWSWSSSSNISLSSTTGKFVTATRVGNGYGWVQATQNVNCAITTRIDNITVGVPQVDYFLVNGQVFSNGYACTNSIQYIQAIPSNVNNSYNWSIQSANPSNASISSLGSTANFQAYTSSCFGISLQMSNVCGTSQAGLSICGQNCFARYTVYPNPAKDYISVEFDQVDSAESLPDQIDLMSESSTKPILTVNVQEAYQNKKLTNGNSIVLDAKDLPRGTYYLRITNNRNKDKPADTVRIILE